MKGLNRCYLIGHLAADPEERVSSTGQSLSRLVLATPHAKKVNGEWKEQADFHRLVAFGKEASFLQRFGRKGDGVALEAVLRPHTWVDKDGVSHREVSLIVDRVLWLGSGGRRPSSPEETATRGEEAAGEPAEAVMPF